MHIARAAALVCAISATVGCGAIKTAAIKSVADTLTEGGTTFTSHNDPQLIADALPFALTFYETLLASIPNYEPQLTATCSAYTQYAFGFVAVDAELKQFDDYEASRALNLRALELALRARDYCWRGLEVRYKGIGAALAKDPAAAVARVKKDHLPLLYWSAASLGAAISLGGLDRPDLLINWPIVRALAERALTFDPAWSNGAIHELLMTVESQGEALGGSEERARQHFARAVEIQRGLAPGPFVGLALGIAKGKQDRAEFTTLMSRAAAIDPDKDPDNRLVTLIMRKRAEFYLKHVDDLFIGLATGAVSGGPAHVR